MKTKRIMALLMCLLTVIGLIPGAAFAAQSTVTIESQTNSAFDYLEYYKDGAWKDLNTPRHWIEQTGEVGYCVEHAAGNPHGDTYTAASPSSVFSASTLSGLNSILMYGYPNNRPSGFTDDEARQATANAIRFWLSEQGEAESYSFTTRRTNPDAIRAKSGYEHVLEYADELLAKARARQARRRLLPFHRAAYRKRKRLRRTNFGAPYKHQQRLHPRYFPFAVRQQSFGLYRRQKRNAHHYAPSIGGRAEFQHICRGYGHPQHR